MGASIQGPETWASKLRDTRQKHKVDSNKAACREHSKRSLFGQMV
jgi:hypothetical protein